MCSVFDPVRHVEGDVSCSTREDADSDTMLVVESGVCFRKVFVPFSFSLCYFVI